MFGLLSGLIGLVTGLFGAKQASAPAGGTVTTTNPSAPPAATSTGTTNSGGILGAIEGAIGAGSTVATDTAGMFGSVEQFMVAITDGKMWRSLGWAIIGLLLIMAGLYMWGKGWLAPPERKRMPVAY
jgi:hypothetical protein